MDNRHASADYQSVDTMDCRHGIYCHSFASAQHLDHDASHEDEVLLEYKIYRVINTDY